MKAENATRFLRKSFSLTSTLLVASLVSSVANAQYSLGSLSLVGATNGGYIYSIDQHGVSDNSPVSAAATQSFTGMDGAGNTQTMTFSGTTYSQSNYGRLHVKTTGSLTNSYYNADNAAYADHDGNLLNADGSPTSLVSLGFATFNDTLHYGGVLESGYQARYIFHVDGFNSGTGYLADLAFDVIGVGSNAFFAFAPGFNDAIWATDTFEVNGITPQQIHVQFSDQIVFDTFNLTDGSDYTGLCDFSSTLTLTGIEMLNASGQRVDGWTVTSESGTIYDRILPQAQDVPEPGALALLLGMSAMGAGLYRRRTARS